MAKQKRIKNEDPSINLRLPQDLKDQLNEIAIKKNQTVSKFVRNLIGEYLSGELYDEEISFYKQHHFITSLEFMQLVIWIYGKRNSDEYLKEEESILPNIINTLKKTGEHLPSEIAEEFEKVLFDILRIKNESDSVVFYMFTESFDHPPTFDYEKVENYLVQFRNSIPVERGLL